MRLRTEISVTLGALLVLQIGTALASIGLMTRVAPTISGIAAENVASGKVVEPMLRALADPNDDSAALFQAGLSAAQTHPTYSVEKDLLHSLEVNGSGALSGEPGARAVVVRDLGRLAAISQAGIDQKEGLAMRLSQVGAWSIAGLGALAYVVSQWSLRRLTRRITQPLRELEDAVLSYRKGDTLRRGAIGEAPAELNTLVAELNGLFDGLRQLQEADGAGPALDRAALLALLDEAEEPVLLLGADGKVRACNKLALDLSPEALAEAARDGDRWMRVELPGSRGALLRRLEPM
jgi:hypothetical protein